MNQRLYIVLLCLQIVGFIMMLVIYIGRNMLAISDFTLGFLEGVSLTLIVAGFCAQIVKRRKGLKK